MSDIEAHRATAANRPLRVFEKVLGGGLGPGNIGVVTARTGTGKVAVLTCIAVDKAMDGRSVLTVTLNRPVSDVRAYRDEVLAEIEKSLDIQDRPAVLTRVERHSRIHTYGDHVFSLERLHQTLSFAREHADFSPELLEIQGWPDFDTVTHEEIAKLKELAQEFGCEVWLTARSRRETTHDDRGMPSNLARLEDLLSVVVALAPQDTHVPLHFVKVHDRTPPQGIHLDFDPTTMLVRWR